jgi:hypothetical protein
MWECKSRASLFVVIAIAAGAASAAAEAPHVNLVWVDPTELAKGTFPAVAAESHALLAATGADVTWTAAPRDAVVGPESLVVIAVPTYSRGRTPERHVMGATRAAGDGALAVWIFPDQVAWALGLDLSLRHGWGERAEMNFARALARVASHEIVHALGATTHSPGGLMAARLDRNALTAVVLRIDRATLATMRLAFDQGAQSAAGAWTPSLRRGPTYTAAAELRATPSSSH